MAGDPKVTFKIELDDSGLRGQLNSIVQQMNTLSKGKNATINVHADTSSAKGAIDKINSDLNSLDGKPATAHIKADNSNATRAVNETEGDLHDIDIASAEAHINADNSNATRAARETEGDLHDIDVATAEAHINADNSNAIEAADDVVSRLDSIANGAAATAHIDADNSAAIAAIDEVEARLQDLNGAGAEVNINGSSGGDGGSGDGGSSGGSGFSMPTSLTGGLGQIFTKGMAYETSEAKASTLMPAGTDMGAWRQNVFGLSAQYGLPSTTYNAAAYNLLSAGQSFTDLPQLLDLSSQLAIGGFSDVDTASGMLARVANGYGTNDYAGIANAVLNAQNAGITEVGKLATAVPNAAANAHAANIDFPNLFSTYAAITKNGIGESQATTQINSIISELGKTGTTGQKTLMEAAKGTPWEGMSFQEMMSKGASMGDVARMYGDYSARTGIPMEDMFSNGMAKQGILNILGADGAGSTFDEALSAMTTSSDAVSTAFETMADTTAQSMNQIVEQFNNSLIQLFTALAPSIQKLADLFADEKFQSTLNNIISQLVDFLSSDAFSQFISALTSAAEALINLFPSNNGGDDSEGGTGFTRFLTGVGDAGKNIGTGIWKWFFGDGGDGESEHASGGGGKSSGSGAGRCDLGNESNGNLAGSAAAMYGNGLGRGQSAGTTGVSVSGVSEISGNASELSSELSDASSSMSDAASSSSGFASAVSTARSNVSRIQTALNALARRIAAVTTPTSGGTDGKKSVGMSYVPRDGYTAVLHKGEAVLTAAQASTWRSGAATNYSGASIDYDALAGAMSKLSLNVNGKRFSRAIERDMSGAQGARYSNLSRRG